MPRGKRKISVFNLSFLDLISGALGAVILLFVVIPKGEGPLTSKQKIGMPDKTVKEIEANFEKIKELNKKVEELKKENMKLIEQSRKKDKELDSSLFSSITEILFPESIEDDLDSGESVALKNVYFYPGRKNFLPGYKPSLDKLVKYLENNPEIRMEISGHIHSRPGVVVSESSFELSVKRAKAVCSYLTQKGIDPKRLECVGKGNTDLKVETMDDAEGTENRRVEAKIIR